MLLDTITGAMGYGFFTGSPPTLQRQGAPVLDTQVPGPLAPEAWRTATLNQAGIGDNLDVTG